MNNRLRWLMVSALIIIATACSHPEHPAFTEMALPIKDTNKEDSKTMAQTKVDKLLENFLQQVYRFEIEADRLSQLTPRAKLLRPQIEQLAKAASDVASQAGQLSNDHLKNFETYKKNFKWMEAPEKFIEPYKFVPHILEKNRDELIAKIASLEKELKSANAPEATLASVFKLSDALTNLDDACVNALTK